VARAIVDLNRPETDRGADGVVKTHTCWGVAVYREFPPADVIERLLDRYYRPYHAKLGTLSCDAIVLGVDCHTMAAVGPPLAADAGRTRPHVCLSDADGTTLPTGWIERFLDCFRDAFGDDVRVNQPFRGGHITRQHARQRPWVQVELSRAPFLSNREKRERVLQALTRFCSLV
jgi:formiminoglutamase